MKLKKRTHYGYSSAYSGPYGGAYEGNAVGWTPAQLSNLRAWYDAELGQPLYGPDPYVQLDGKSGDYIFTPDSANLDIAGDVEVVMRVKCNDWTAAATQTLCGKYVSSGNQRSWRFYVNSAGNVGLSASADGTAVTTATVTPTTPLPDATWIWLRLRLDLSDGANSVGTLETAADQVEEPTSWTANGSATSTIIASIFNSTSPLEIGTFANGTLERFSGQIARCIVRDGFDGPVVADFDARRCYGPGYTQGLPTTADGSKYVQLYGRSGDYIYTADKASLDITGDIEFVARVACENWATGSNQTIIAKADAANDRAYFFYIGVTGAITVATSPDGTSANQQVRASTTPPPAVAGRPLWVKATIDVDDGAGNRVYNFYYAEDQIAEPTNWTLLTSATIVGATSIYTNARILEIGTRAGGTSERLAGKVFRAIVRDGINGTTVADYNAQNAWVNGEMVDAYTNEWRVNNPKAQAWTLGLPKIYDRSGNNVAPATFGSGSNQPRWLPWIGKNRIFVPSAAGSYAVVSRTSTPGSMATLEYRARVMMTTIGTTTYLVGSGSTHSALYVTTTGALRVYQLNTPGTVKIGEATSPSVVPWVLNHPVWVRAKLTISDANCEYWYSFDDTNDHTAVSWTSLGSAIGSNAGTTPLLTEAAKVMVGANSVGIASGTDHSHLVTVSIVDDTNVIGIHAADYTQSAGTNSIGSTGNTGQTITIGRPSAGRKTVVQSPAARSARSVILLGTDDWIDVPAAAVPALDTFAAASSVTASFRRWHNPGASGHAIFATKASLADQLLGLSIRLSTTAASTDIRCRVGDATTADGPSDVAVALGVRAVSTTGVGDSAPFITGQINDSAMTGDTNRNTTVSTSTGGAGRIGAYTGGTGAIDMEFEALVCRDVATTDTEHGLQVAYYGGGL